MIYCLCLQNPQASKYFYHCVRLNQQNIFLFSIKITICQFVYIFGFHVLIDYKIEMKLCQATIVFQQHLGHFLVGVR